MLIDSHAHLDDKRFNRDRDALIKKLKDDGVEYVINNGADLQTSLASIKLAEKYDNIYATIGVHPHDTKDMDETTIEAFRQLSSHEKVVAIGEIGLDFHYDNSPRDVQRKWFREQLKLAKELDLPVTIHSREASQEVFDMIKEEQDGSLRGVMHCYSDSVELAKEYLKIGFYISLAGPVTFKNSRVAKEVAKIVPIDKLLIETDSPYLTPEPNRGKRNEPSYVRYVAAEVAELRDMSYDDLVSATNKNAKEFYGIK